MSKNQELNTLAHKYIPGGAHTYSRGDDQYPSNAPKVLARGQGCRVWDVDGREFLDFGMALRAITVGYNNERISKAAILEIQKGNNLTRASETEILAAQDLCELVPGCEMVKFGKNGSTVVSAAVKLSRAFTGRSIVARCGDHPFFSYDDWFIGNTVVNSGVPSELKELTQQFTFNDLESLRTLFAKYPGKIACVVLEPATSVEPAPGFLQGVIDLAREQGCISIFDEMITGFRWHTKGASHYYNVRPDMLTFGKGMANGFSVSAVGGRRDILELGGIHHERERVFLASTTHGAEMCGLGAFRETLKVYEELDVTSHLWKMGRLLCDGINAIASELGISEQFKLEGASCSPVFVCKDRTGSASLPFRTLFIQEMVSQGVLMPWIAMCFMHKERDIEHACIAARKALVVYRNALEGKIETFLEGPAIRPVFRKFN